eukprot:TRINITY_DN629_c1_g3_i2.p1 TRINITY_DN629_c1_g3~~TRINITY_DN629_c1_g3_i2.p1  ORF type:complete len:133 (-),score=9.74 TRINITY_DN629_c1_g3_i2:219-617(-)
MFKGKSHLRTTLKNHPTKHKTTKKAWVGGSQKAPSPFTILVRGGVGLKKVHGVLFFLSFFFCSFVFSSFLFPSFLFSPPPPRTKSSLFFFLRNTFWHDRNGGREKKRKLEEKKKEDGFGGWELLTPWGKKKK